MLCLSTEIESKMFSMHQEEEESIIAVLENKQPFIRVGSL
jgi:hypothetical protein